MSRCTQALIYKDNLEYNIKQIKNSVGKNVKVCLAVKADAYGHDAILTSQLAEKNGIDFLAVATIDEGIELREAGIKLPILLLSLCVPDEFEEIFKNNITPLVFSKEYINLLIKASELFFSDETKFAVHLAVDTGMGRIGCYPQDAGEEAKLINNSKNLILSGMCTHFAVSDSLSQENQEYTKNQYNKFMQAIQSVKNEGFDPGICHCACSAAFLNNKDMHFDMIRAGIITYGYYPDEITAEYLQKNNKNFNVKPIMALKTKIVSIRHFNKGQFVSYGRTWQCTKETNIAVLPIGYADGLLRRFSPGLNVTINGKDYPIVGRICMDQCMVDIGLNNSEVALWDDVYIFGPKDCGANNSAQTLAQIGNTISYEVCTSISKRVKRIIV